MAPARLTTAALPQNRVRPEARAIAQATKPAKLRPCPAAPTQQEGPAQEEGVAEFDTDARSCSVLAEVVVGAVTVPASNSS